MQGPGFAGEGAGDGDTLLLAPRQLPRIVRDAACEAHAVEPGEGPRLRVVGACGIEGALGVGQRGRNIEIIVIPLDRDAHAWWPTL